MRRVAVLVGVADGVRKVAAMCQASAVPCYSWSSSYVARVLATLVALRRLLAWAVAREEVVVWLIYLEISYVMWVGLHLRWAGNKL